MRRSVIVARSVARDVLHRLSSITASGVQSDGLSVNQAVDYALSSASLILERGHLTDVAEKRVLEIGPGDNLAFALCMIAFGAKSVTALDRFTVRADAERQRQIYLALLRRFAGVEAQRLRTVLSKDGLLISDKVRLIRNLAIETADRHLGPASFDLILSVAACEHLRDVRKGLAVMNGLLTPSGSQLHQIDLQDHGLFSSRGHSPLEWLTTSDLTHRFMVRNSGGPNRRLVVDYRRILDELDCIYRIDISCVAGEPRELDPYAEKLHFGEHYGVRHRELLRSVRERLAPRFRSWPDEDLLCAGIFLQAHKG